MKLIRMAMIRFSESIGEKYLSKIYRLKGVLLQFHSVKLNNVEDETTFPYFLIAQIGLEKQPETQNNFVTPRQNLPTGAWRVVIIATAAATTTAAAAFITPRRKPRPVPIERPSQAAHACIERD